MHTRSFYFYHRTPAGLSLVVALAADGRPGYVWRVIGDGHEIVSTGVAPDPRTALVCLRIAFALLMDRARDGAGRAIEAAVQGVVS